MGGNGKGLTLAFFLVSLLCHAEGSNGSTPDGASPAGGVFPTEGGNFPVIARLDWRDDTFKQYTADVQANRRRVYNREVNQRGNNRENAQNIANSLTVYQYTPGNGEDLLSLAARCSIPYSSLASLNRISHPSMIEVGKPLLLPSSPGLFVPGEPESELERLLASSRFPFVEGDATALVIGARTENSGNIFYYFPGGEFSATERAFFFNTGFRLPLRSFRLTSGYGPRINPVTGNLRTHEGVDLAAPAGTEVYAAADGIVTETGEDSIYGNYIIIKHAGDWASLYGHLQRIGVTLRSNVRSGMLIGWVGSTGQSTGPHLHFELRQNGRARDPDKYLFLPTER
jgi:murein DD-endopeptidase MepM/ murein hydrolase activator NlpD